MEKTMPTPEFLPKLLTWLKATKADPKYSRKLANFVLKREAFHVFKVTYTEAAPSYLQRTPIPGLPEDRFDARTLCLSDRDTYVPDPEGYVRGTDLWLALSEGGSAHVHMVRNHFTESNFRIVEDVTLLFWERYMQIGKCLFDHTHREYGSFRHWSSPGTDAGRFHFLDAQTAQCKWCGDILHLHRTLRVDVQVRTSWEHAPVDGEATTFRCTRCHRRHPIADYHQSLEGRGPRRRDGHTSGSTFAPRDITSKGLCPSCFLAETMEDPCLRKALMPLEVLTQESSVSSD